MKYYSKVKVVNHKKEITEKRYVSLPDGLLKIKDIQTHLNSNESFYFMNDDEVIDSDITMVIYTFRKETDEEFSRRLKKEVEYNKNYDSYHSKNIK